MNDKHRRAAVKIGELVDLRSRQYGDGTTDSVEAAGAILGILYPGGVRPDQYRDMLLISRVLDKLFRVANGDQGEESAWVDLAGYGLRGAVLRDEG